MYARHLADQEFFTCKHLMKQKVTFQKSGRIYTMHILMQYLKKKTGLIWTKENELPNYL